MQRALAGAMKISVIVPIGRLFEITSLISGSEKSQQASRLLTKITVWQRGCEQRRLLHRELYGVNITGSHRRPRILPGQQNGRDAPDMLHLHGHNCWRRGWSYRPRKRFIPLLKSASFGRREDAERCGSAMPGGLGA